MNATEEAVREGKVIAGNYEFPEGREVYIQKQKKVLVVDDEPLTREYLCELLNEAGFETSVASSRKEFFKEMKNGKAEVVLLDILLGDENGLDCLEEFRALYPSVPVIVLTAWGYDEIVMQDAHNKGAVAYLSKTDHAHILITTLKKLLV